MPEPSTLVTITTAMLRDELTAVEAENLPSAVGDNTTPEKAEKWLEEKVRQACDRVVAAINSCHRNAAIKAGLCRVPAGCVRLALVLARHAVISALPALSETLEGSSRAAEYNTATRDLSALASCELVPEYELGDEEAAGEASGIALLVKPADSFDW